MCVCVDVMLSWCAYLYCLPFRLSTYVLCVSLNNYTCLHVSLTTVVVYLVLCNGLTYVLCLPGFGYACMPLWISPVLATHSSKVCTHGVVHFITEHVMDMCDVHTCLYMGLQETPLYLACSWGHVAAAKELVKRGANVTAQNEDKLNCLDIAVDKGHEYVDQCTIFLSPLAPLTYSVWSVSDIVHAVYKVLALFLQSI